MLTMNDLPGWAVASRDQMEAAIENKDPAGYARVAVDGMLKAAYIDAGETGGRLYFMTALRTLSGLDKDTLMLMLAEAMCRLYNEGEADG